MNRPLLTLLGLAVSSAALWGLLLWIGVWLPDVFTREERLLATRTLASGRTFQVVQYWNGLDFYTTELRITSPGGQRAFHTLDGDDSKTWSVPLTVDEATHTVTVVLKGDRTKTVVWE